MFLGMAYHPSYWPKERWPIDARMMREANIGAARVGEFAWSRFEPREGEFDFGWMDEAVEVLAKEGVKTIMCTPTATPTAWLTHKHPEILPVDENGLLAKRFGARRHYCCNVPAFREYTCEIVTAMAEHYGENANVIGWQIDNEVGNVYMLSKGRCYCEACRKEFSRWLEAQYGSLEALNSAWGTVFWSQEYTDWKQIVLPRRGTAGEGLNPSHVLAYERFVGRVYRAAGRDHQKVRPEPVGLDQLCVRHRSRDDRYAGGIAVPGRLRVVSLHRGLERPVTEPRLSCLEFARPGRGICAFGRLSEGHPRGWQLCRAGGGRSADEHLFRNRQGCDGHQPLHVAQTALGSRIGGRLRCWIIREEKT